MTTRQKAAIAKAAVPSPGQLVKSQSAPLESQEPVQPASEMLTMKDLQTALSAALSSVNDRLDKLDDKLEEKMAEQKKDFKAMIEASNLEMREDIVEAIKGVWDYTIGVEEKLENVEQQFEEKLEEIRSDVQDQAILTQFYQMQFAVRIRGFKDISNENQEDLRKILTEALAKFLDDTIENVAWQIDRLFRMNSRIAAQRNLPRDIVIYFNTRKFRNWILSTAYNKQLSVAGQEVQVLKEIPPKMLRSRKDYAFLTEELKKRQIQYRWEVPTGLSLFFKNNRYRLTTVAKAKDFFENILMVDRPTSPRPKMATLVKDIELLQPTELQLPRLISSVVMDKTAEQPVQSIDIFQPLVGDKAKDQRHVRESTKNIQQREKIQPTQTKQADLTSMEAMGARPKRQEEVEWSLQKLSRKGHVK